MRTQTRVTLVEFREGTKYWRYVDSEVGITAGGKEYSPLVLVLGTLKARTKVKGSDSLSIQIPKLSSLGAFVRLRQMTPGLSVVLRTVKVSDIGAVTFDPSVARGTVVSHQADEGTLTFEVESIAQGLATIGLRKSYSKLCTHTLYGSACRVNKAANTLQATSDSFVALPRGGAVVSFVDSIGVEDEWANGSLSFDYGGVTIGSQIITNTDTTATLSVSPREIPSGVIVTLVRGCNLTFDTCQSVFSNSARFGGFPYFNISLNPFKYDTFEVNNELNVFSFDDIPSNYFEEIS